jgi:hypothetical protein
MGPDNVTTNLLRLIYQIWTDPKSKSSILLASSLATCCEFYV